MLTIYGLFLSSPSNKVRYTANHLKIPYEFIPINLASGQQRSAEYLKINPYGRVPAIDDNGFTLAESNAIIRYLAAKQGDSLYPSDLKTRALVDQWMDYAAMHVGLATSKLMFNTYFYKSIPNMTCDERSLQEGRKFLGQYLPVVEQPLTKLPFLVGKTITLADIAMLAHLDVCELVDVDLSIYPHLMQWRQKLQRESFYRDCHENYAQAFHNAMLQKSK